MGAQNIPVVHISDQFSSVQQTRLVNQGTAIKIQIVYSSQYKLPDSNLSYR
jgi:hypothetical protein